MGMFDYVSYEDTCDSCGSQIPEGNFQTKSEGCNLDVLEPKEVSYFNGYCGKCNHINRYTTKRTFILHEVVKDDDGNV